MIGSIRRYFKFRKYPNFWDFIRGHPTESLEDLAREATDCTLIRQYNPYADTYVNKGEPFEQIVNDIYEHFSSEIWIICLRAASPNAVDGLPIGIKNIARLPLSDEVHNDKTMREFLVRNAFQTAAQDILKEIKER